MHKTPDQLTCRSCGLRASSPPPIAGCGNCGGTEWEGSKATARSSGAFTLGRLVWLASGMAVALGLVLVASGVVGSGSKVEWPPGGLEGEDPRHLLKNEGGASLSDPPPDQVGDLENDPSGVDGIGRSPEPEAHDRNRSVEEHRRPRERKRSSGAQVLGTADWSDRGRLLISKGRRQEARDAFARAAELAPSNPVAWADLAAAEGLLGHVAEAVAAYGEALKLDPELWIAHYNLALLFARHGEVEKACSHLKQGLGFLRLQGSSYLPRVLEDLHSNSDLEDLRHEDCFLSLPMEM